MMDEGSDRWCILRTSAARTLPLAAALAAAGLEVWTPSRTTRRTIAPGRKNERTVEIAAPILPGFVFAPACHLTGLAIMEVDERSLHPAFSIFRHAGRVPLVRGRDVAGLRAEEMWAAAQLQAIHDAETRAEADRLRVAALKSERARRKAMRAERRQFATGEQVALLDVPGFAGMTGVIESSDGRSAVVAFGGSLTMTVEAWQIVPRQVKRGNIAA